MDTIEEFTIENEHYLLPGNHSVFIAVRGGELTWTPLNVVTKVGNSVTLTCAGTELSWVEYITNPGDSDSKTITFGTNITIKSTYDLNTDPDGKYELIIKSPVLLDCGRYRCKDKWNEANRGDAELIVFGKTF